LKKIENYVAKFNIGNRFRHVLYQVLAILSLIVILCVFWGLKLTGITMAGEAFCGIQDHIHVASCYSDISADLETNADWDQAFADMVRGPTTKENVVLVAQSQIGYTESTQNFEVDANGIRRGITRYGQWYGNPYGDWSTMFASFCLNYAGAMDAPMNSGAEAMRLEWEAADLYNNVSQSLPEIGNLIFIRKDADATVADSVAIITGVDETTITAIAGDWENTVAEIQLQPNDPVILGYGLTPEAPIMMLAAEPRATNYTVWLDGTDGGLGHLTGSPNTAYTVKDGSILKLPTEWTSPSKYSYKLRGWYDVTNSRYYLPGGEMKVTGNAVLYADWVASTYDIGEFNAEVADTVSTSSFVTTYMFDYNYLFNIQSSNAQVSVSSSSHSETWSMVTSGKVNYNGQQTADFVFTDNDGQGRLNIPSNRNNRNRYQDATTVTSGIYSAALGEVLFSPNNAFNPDNGSGILGKTYLGTGDHLLQIMDDPTDENYGYYYYDSKKNAASYNQSNGRFYVYDYLAATSDSIGGAYSDFLPLNSPYANNNGKTIGRYTYAGVDGEYQGVSHYRYDSKYNSGNNNSANNVNTDYAYGMRMDVKCYLPNTPGSGGNKDMHGNNMQFKFSGDDDLWVLIDGVVVLDIGGIHQIVDGSIDFSTGQVTVNGTKQSSLTDRGIGAGDHTMTVLYLERGASMSNCAIYFNVAPRFGLQIHKEDILTQQLLDGTQFTVYKDFECTQPAKLWESENAYNQDMADGVADNFQSTFTVENGVAKLWGVGSGNTYYIKETGPPNKKGYGVPNGVIRIKIKREGQATYLVDVIADAQGNEPSNGFTVHGVDINEETQTVNIVVTNAPETVVETTTVQVIKKWQNSADHSSDYIKAYLTVTDPDGTVRRIREVTLSDENDWMYIWTNLPKYDYNTLTEVQYGIEESYESGYYSSVRQITHIEISKTQWAEALSFQNGATYILKTTNGYLSTLDDKADTGYKWVDELTAKSSPNALWTATVSGSTVKFTNGIGQTITFYYNGGSPTDFYATSNSPNQQSRQDFSYSNQAGGLQIFYKQGNTSYYLTGSLNSSKKLGYSTSASSALIFNPICRITQTDIREVEDWAYQITNIPLEPSNETSMTVNKEWVIPGGYDVSLYQEYAVTMRLLANGVNTGRSISLNLKNNWQGSFLGLPLKDDNGNVIQYTVVEVWAQPRWTVEYGEIKTSGSSPPTYSVVVTNTFNPGGPILPSTGTRARLIYILCGCAIMLGTLVYAFETRRKRKKRIN